MLRCRKKVLPFQISSMTATISTTRTSASRRALSRRELVAAPADCESLRTELRLTRQRLRNSLSKLEGPRLPGGTHVSFRPCGAMLVEPALEHKHGPQPGIAPDGAREMRLPHPPDWIGAKEALILQSALAEQGPRPVPQRPLKPF